MLGRTNAQQSRRNERDHLKFMRAKWYSRLHPPGASRRFYYRCRDGVGEGEEGETKPEMGSHSYSGAVAVAVRCRSELPGSLPLLPSDVPAGEMGRDHKNLRAGVSFCHRCL